MAPACPARLMSAVCLAMLLAAGRTQARLSERVEVFATDLNDPPGEIARPCEPPESEQAEISDQQAPVPANELRRRPLQAHGHHSLGKLYATIGCRAEAHAELSTAIVSYRAMEMTFWLPQAKAALAQVEGR